jgi:hypothetical protein
VNIFNAGVCVYRGRDLYEVLGIGRDADQVYVFTGAETSMRCWV